MNRVPHRRLCFESRPLIMGVLNVTPDSFSDGGAFLGADAALRHAEDMLGDGADIIDVGAESTRPGAQPVDADEQLRRAIPVIRRLRRAHDRPAISIDTRLASVAEAAIEAGADIVNDVSALRDDPAMAALAADRQVTVVLMHMQGAPATMQLNPTYGDVVKEIIDFLRTRAAAATKAGIPEDRLILDPGIGFGKTTEHNIEIMRNLEQFVTMGLPVLVGASRKRFLADAALSQKRSGDKVAHATAGSAEGLGRAAPADVAGADRLGGSLACVVRAIGAGVHVVRVHDVGPTRQLIDTLAALQPRR